MEQDATWYGGGPRPSDVIGSRSLYAIARPSVVCLSVWKSVEWA